jgi:tRNA nucleotidyltransferase (CCA-adding enzyme)
MANTPPQLVLLPAEQLLRELLLECAQHFPGLEIWIVGGWVRDRLLGIPSSDLDLALSNVTGRGFGKFLESFSAEPEIESKYRQKVADLGIAGSRFTRFHIMERNAGMSKKLETAGGKLFGLDIDLVNLRKEVYDGQSRTPEMEFGTPEEDALRRDTTVNSLFFHPEKQEIVDLTGRGLKDLDARIMKTPLDPRQTFMDDPLRVLRLIRIGSKLGFAMDPEAMRCIKDREIRRALDTMITRDRIGIELFKMMTDPSPEVAFQHLFESNLYTPVFIRLDSYLLQSLQAEFSMLGLSTSSLWPTTWPRAYRLLAYLLKDRSNLGLMVQSEENINYLWTMAAYAPIAGLRKNYA